MYNQEGHHHKQPLRQDMLVVGAHNYTEPGKASAANPHHDSKPSTGWQAWMALQGKAMTTNTLNGCPGYQLHT